jgi:hypothetical protein
MEQCRTATVLHTADTEFQQCCQQLQQNKISVAVLKCDASQKVLIPFHRTAIDRRRIGTNTFQSASSNVDKDCLNQHKFISNF